MEMVMTAFSRALILAGLVAVTGASGALADTKDRNAARAEEPTYQSSAPVQVYEGRASVQGPAHEKDGKSWLLDRRSSEYNHR
jgi:hypothetical protein